MIIADLYICELCNQELNLTLDNELECLKCGYIKNEM
jgi:DNA-directed RNA polymerase subunit RPC12/RpoP